ncbi:hypothetical protein PINS_up012180 [Pythium insidiosum]|nr:hypothetical protein PINS_up012180 [Pythium insidiosum]
MALRLDELVQRAVAQEQAAKAERAAIESERRGWENKEHELRDERQRLEARESRLHAQLRQMETVRRRWHDERRVALQRLGNKTTVEMATGRDFRLEAAAKQVTPLTRSTQQSTTTPAAPVATAPIAPVAFMASKAPMHPTPSPVPVKQEVFAAQDPSGLAPDFRRLIEESWAKMQSDVDPTSAALRKERLWLHSLGIKSSNPASQPSVVPSVPVPHPQPSTQRAREPTRGGPQRMPPPPRTPLVRVQL